ncbi:hypothetical protein E2C01_102258 [Portunus trituberculatus]|uniref:Uncharacterized protein n=1 Tax=Portunus trituberculatus TaxID=210409 RepID=A0A5B7KHW7_PORTR|nr:hypothetical protein [Portunus trituberculatus]
MVVVVVVIVAVLGLRWVEAGNGDGSGAGGGRVIENRPKLEAYAGSNAYYTPVTFLTPPVPYKASTAHPSFPSFPNTA